MHCLHAHLQRHRAIGIIGVIVLTALLQYGCQSLSHTHYSTSFNAAHQSDLVKLKNTDNQGHMLYLDRYSIVLDRKKRDWRHAMLISTPLPDAQASVQPQTSSSIEVTVNCTTQRISIDLVRVHPNPFAQGEPIHTQAFNDGFVIMREQQGMGKQLYKELCR